MQGDDFHKYDSPIDVRSGEMLGYQECISITGVMKPWGDREPDNNNTEYTGKLGAMFEDITTPVFRREAVVSKAEDVIAKSLKTVQQIASLLGENAAETEIVLNSIIEEFNVHSTERSGDFGLVEESDGEDK